MAKDKEIEALATVSEALSGLDEEVVKRILQWAANRYGVTIRKRADEKAEDKEAHDTEETSTFSDVNELFDAAEPSTNSERALVIAYWLQEIEGQPDFMAQTVNTQLKHMGHPITNITRALQLLIDRKPSLVMQVKKSGTSKQARKRYKITTAGRRHVDEMISITHE